MADQTTPRGEEPSPASEEDQVIRQRVRHLASEALRRGRVDPEAVRGIVLAMTGPMQHEIIGDTDNRQKFAEAAKRMGAELVSSASVAHAALEQVASRGQGFTDNDLKEALATLTKLEETCAAASKAVAEAMSMNLRKEMMEVAAHAQNVGVEATARIANVMGDVVARVGESGTSGLQAIRGASGRMALLASGVLAGFADALRDQSEATKRE
jgi:hypothetical protein